MLYYTTNRHEKQVPDAILNFTEKTKPPEKISSVSLGTNRQTAATPSLIIQYGGRHWGE